MVFLVVPAVVQLSFGAATLDFCTPVESVSSSLFYLFIFTRSSPPLHSVSQRTNSRKEEEEG